MLEGGPDPLRRKPRLVPDVEADQADGFLDACRSGLGAGSCRILSTGEIDQRVPGVELIDQIPVLFAVRMRYDTLSMIAPIRPGSGLAAVRIVSIGSTVSSVNFS